MGSRFPSPISEERARREGRNGHGRGGRAAAVDSYAGAARGVRLWGKVRGRCEDSIPPLTLGGNGSRRWRG